MVVKINGVEMSRTGVVVKKVSAVVDDITMFLKEMFRGSMDLAIKIGLLVFLYPYIAKFFIGFAKLVAQAAGMPF